MNEEMWIPLSHLRKVVRSMRNRPDDTKITFSYLIGGCFPKAYKRIQADLREHYEAGYQQGLEDGRNEN